MKKYIDMNKEELQGVHRRWRQSTKTQKNWA